MKKILFLFMLSTLSFAAIFEKCETDDFDGPKVALHELEDGTIEAHVGEIPPINIFKSRETEKGKVFFGKEFFFEVYYKIGSSPVSFLPGAGYFFRGIMYLKGDVTTAFCRD